MPLDKEEAARAYSTAISLFAEVGDKHKQSQVLRALSLLRLRQIRWLEAMIHMEESLRVRPRRGVTGWDCIYYCVLLCVY